ELVGLVESSRVRFPAPAHLERLQEILVPAPNLEEAGAGRRQQPLVTVGPIEIGSDVVQVERDERRSVGAIDNGGDSAASRRSAHPTSRQHHARRRQDMTKEK